jgi:hypothetical protein
MMESAFSSLRKSIDTSISAVSSGASIPSLGVNRSHGLHTSNSSFFGTNIHSHITVPVFFNLMAETLFF